jgi:hypothetical protein
MGILISDPRELRESGEVDRSEITNGIDPVVLVVIKLDNVGRAISNGD